MSHAAVGNLLPFTGSFMRRLMEFGGMFTAVIMKIYTLALAMIASAGLGAGAVQGLHAQAPPRAYVVTIFDKQIHIKEHDHPSLAPATFQPFGGRYIVHFGDVVAFEGAIPNDIVIIAFDSMDKAQA
jgi:uncharacterized protein DUF1330